MPPGSPGPSAAAAPSAAAPSAAAFSVAGAGLTPTKESTLKSGIVSALASQAARSSALVSAAPRTLSKADALSVRVHASSPLVPTSTLVSPVVRVHLVDSELGTPITPSGEATTPLQTLPFDLARRVKSAFAPEWDETLEIEEELGSLLSDRATLLFEVLQPPPSFRYFDERPDVFPGGAPAKIAWGFLKLLKSRDQTPNVGRLQVQLYRYEEVSTPHALVSSLAPRGGVTSDGAPGAVPASDRAPAVFAEWKRASRLVPALRPLYPAHLTVTVAASPRGDAATALLAGSREMPRTFALAATLSGAAPDDDEDFEKRRPSLAERIARERTLGGGWSTAERRLARAPPADGEEVTEKLGRLPYETLCYGMNPRAAAAARGARGDAGGPPRGSVDAADPDAHHVETPGGSTRRPIVKLPHGRSRLDDCEVPNGEARAQPHLPSSAREALLVAFDPMGRRLAVACVEASMRVVRAFDCATGAQIAAFPGHGAAVYDLAWEPEPDEPGSGGGAEDRLGTVEFDPRPTRVLTASADGAARAWTVHGAPESPSAFDFVAQHACECYAAAWHSHEENVLATAARDGGIRLWSAPPKRKSGGASGGGALGGALGGSSSGLPQAQILASLSPSPGTAVTALAFDGGGFRLFCGFADGMMRESAVDVGGAAGASLRPLRECKDLLGETVTCVRTAPNDRKVLARTVADRIASVDVGFFGATHSYELGARSKRRTRKKAAGGGGGSPGGLGSSSNPSSSFGSLARFASSPDGRWIAAGDADGCCRLFDADVAGAGVPMAVADAAPGVGIRDVAWSPGAHCVAVAAAGGGRPLRLVAKTDAREDAPVPRRPTRPGAVPLGLAVEGKERIKALRAASGFAAEDKPRPMLPTHLTPDAVREMLGRVRVDAARERSAAIDDARRERRAAANANIAGVTGASAAAAATPGGWGVGAQASFAPTAATSIGGTAASGFDARRAAAEKENESVGAAAAAAGKGPPASWDSRGFEEPAAGFGLGGEGVLSGAHAVSAFDPYGGGGAAAPAPEEPAGFGLGGEGFLSGARIPPSGASAGGW